MISQGKMAFKRRTYSDADFPLNDRIFIPFPSAPTRIFPSVPDFVSPQTLYWKSVIAARKLF
jgi:hypothetical protein